MSLTLFNASAEATVANIERLILKLTLSEKGIYLLPENLRNIKSNLAFIPKTLLPRPEETYEKASLFFTPPQLTHNNNVTQLMRA